MAQGTMAPEWRVCKRFPAYEVSDQGNVRRVDDKRPMAASPDQAGYVAARLTISPRNSKTIRIHRLVCEAFHGDPNGLEVNHINGIRHDNRAANLEWVTRAENTSQAKMHRKRGRFTVSGVVLCEADVLSIRRRYAQGGVTQTTLATEYGVTQGTIAHIVLDKTWRHVTLTQDIRSMAQNLRGKELVPVAIYI